MDNLQDLLSRRTPQEPPEIQMVKDFVRDKYDEPVNVSVQDRQITITVGSASLAGTLRSHTVEILTLCKTPDKRLVLRIGTVTE
jgi:hypothetical protein